MPVEIIKTIRSIYRKESRPCGASRTVDEREPSGFPLIFLLPLDGAGRLARGVEHDPVDALALVHDPVAAPGHHLEGHARPLRGHRVLAGHHADRADVGV